MTFSDVTTWPRVIDHLISTIGTGMFLVFGYFLGTAIRRTK